MLQSSVSALPSISGSEEDLDLALHAIADRHRRHMLEQLCTRPASASDLASSFSMSLSGILQHLKVLERGGLVHSEKAGRTRMFRVQPDGFRKVEQWVTERRALWEGHFDRLGVALGKVLETTPLTSDTGTVNKSRPTKTMQSPNKKERS